MADMFDDIQAAFTERGIADLSPLHLRADDVIESNLLKAAIEWRTAARNVVMIAANIADVSRSLSDPSVVVSNKSISDGSSIVSWGIDLIRATTRRDAAIQNLTTIADIYKQRRNAENDAALTSSRSDVDTVSGIDASDDVRRLPKHRQRP